MPNASKLSKLQKAILQRLGSLGHNLIGNTSGGTDHADSDLVNVDPLLGPLRDNGDPTQTMALLPGSPAIDAGDNTDAPDFDQRGPGFARIVNGIIDIGAFEVQDGGNGPGQAPRRDARLITSGVAALLLASRSAGYAGFSSSKAITIPGERPFPELVEVDRFLASLRSADFTLLPSKHRHTADADSCLLDWLGEQD